MVSIQLESEHGYVMLVVAGTVLVNLWQMSMVHKYILIIQCKLFWKRGRQNYINVFSDIKHVYLCVEVFSIFMGDHLKF